jgi:transcriptional regulator with XRE-family HTH domain
MNTVEKKRTELKDRLQIALDLREKKAVDLARDLKIPKSAISQYLSGNRTIKDSKRLYIIAEYLGVSEAWLMGFDVPMKRHLADIEEEPVGIADKLADLFIALDAKQVGSDEMLMIERYRKLDEQKKAQVQEFVRFLLGQD